MGIKIVTVSCSHCPRWFRTSLAVAEAGELPKCPDCGHTMTSSEPQPLTSLSRIPLKRAVHCFACD